MGHAAQEALWVELFTFSALREEERYYATVQHWAEKYCHSAAACRAAGSVHSEGSRRHLQHAGFFTVFTVGRAEVGGTFLWMM